MIDGASDLRVQYTESCARCQCELLETDVGEYCDACSDMPQCARCKADLKPENAGFIPSGICESCNYLDEESV